MTMSCGVGHRCDLDPLLWLWCRPAAVAPIRPLAWEPPYTAGTILKKTKQNKTKKAKKQNKNPHQKKQKNNKKVFSCFLIIHARCLNLTKTQKGAMKEKSQLLPHS